MSAHCIVHLNLQYKVFTAIKAIKIKKLPAGKVDKTLLKTAILILDISDYSIEQHSLLLPGAKEGLFLEKREGNYMLK